MPNHWHMLVSPEVDREMGRFGKWLGLTHTQRHHAQYETAGNGHLYQGRFKSFPSRMTVTCARSADMSNDMRTRRICVTHPTNGDLAACGGGRTVRSQRSPFCHPGQLPGEPTGLNSSPPRLPTRRKKPCNDQSRGQFPVATSVGSTKKSDASVRNQRSAIVEARESCPNPHNGT